MQAEPIIVSVSECVALVNVTLDGAFPALAVEGEVAGFKVNHQNYVFFDLKDASGTLSCFMTVYQLRVPLENGMRVRAVVRPTVTKWGKFSLTVRAVAPIGEGSLKRAYELLKEKLGKEGLFDTARKRLLPTYPDRVAVISSRQAAGYADFMKIASRRWPLATIVTKHVKVQGESAADGIIEALQVCNTEEPTCDVIVLIRGGGSADDLSLFNDEKLVRAAAVSRIPLVAGIGHETDETLVTLAADIGAATPSNAAELTFPDAAQVALRLSRERRVLDDTLRNMITAQRQRLAREKELLLAAVTRIVGDARGRLDMHRRLLAQLDPNAALRRGYSLVRDNGMVVRDGSNVHPGTILQIETEKAIIESEVKRAYKK